MHDAPQPALGAGATKALGAVITILAAAVVFAGDAAAQAEARVGFRAALSPDTIYVGQQATYSLTVRIPVGVRRLLRRNPEFVPPEARGMLAYELPLARRSDAEAEAELHTFRRALFVLTPGRYSIAPARLTYSMPQSASFFSREEEQVLRSEGVSVVAIEPPTTGRPADWRGAVGSWRVSARVEPSDPRVGDPVVLTLRLEGEGNPTMLPRPALSLDWADLVPDDERVVLEAAPLLLGGSKEFSWLLTPRVQGRQLVPVIEYAFFDPVARGYAVARSVPVPLQVRPGSVVSLPPRRLVAGDTVPVALRPALMGARTVGIDRPLWWLLFAGLAPLPVLLRGLWARSRARPTATRDAPRTPRALLERTLRARAGVDVGAHTAPGALAAALTLEGVTPETAAEVEKLRDACDSAVYAGTTGRTGGAPPRESAGSLRARTESLMRRVANEARRRGALCLVMAATFTMGCAAATDDHATALTAFAEGQTAYAGGDYARARDAFGRAALAAPRDAAAWSNYGAAGWQAADTAAAVIGWQRALRLDPTSAALRERLRRVRAPQLRGAARVWPLPPVALATAAALLWLLGWLWAFLRQRRSLPLRRVNWLLLPGLLLAIGAAYTDQRLAARDLVVVTQPSPLRALPALGADAGAVPLAGEVARVVERRGVWYRLELEGGRGGWYPAERVVSLARD